MVVCSLRITYILYIIPIIGRKGCTMYFKLFTGEDGQTYFSGLGNNNEVMIQSEGYKQKQSALETIATIKREAAEAPITDQTGDDDCEE